MKGTTGNAVLDEALGSLLDMVIDSNGHTQKLITALGGITFGVDVITTLIKFGELNSIQESILGTKLRVNELFRELAWAWDKEKRILAITQVEFVER